MKKGERILLKSIVPGLPEQEVEFVGVQKVGLPDFPEYPLFSLTKDVEGHRAGSTVSHLTLKSMGYVIPDFNAEERPKPKPLTPQQDAYAQQFLNYLDGALGHYLQVSGREDEEAIRVSLKLLLGLSIRNGVLKKYEKMEIKPNKDVSVLATFTMGMTIWLDLFYGKPTES